MRALVVCWISVALLGPRALAQEFPPIVFTQTPPPPPAASAPPTPQSTAVNPSAAAKETPGRPLVENLQPFDPGTIELIWSGNRWLLTAGSAVLKDFGRRESEGRQAVRIIRALRLNQYGTVGSPAPEMEYWLIDGAAPHGPVSGCTTLNFDSASLHVEETLGQWCLRDSRRVLFNFGSRPDEARQAYGVIRKYGFAQVAVVGPHTPSMFIFLANRYGNAEAADGTHPPHQLVKHESPEVAARKAEELKRLKERIPGLDAETVAQPTLRPLRTPNQPHQPFSSNTREFGGEGPHAGNGKRPIGGVDHGDRVAFDWRRVEMRLERNAWRLMAGSLELANFGADEIAARRALEAIRYYRFTEQHIVGGPERHFSYFLVNGLAPHGLPFGVPGEMFQPEALKVREVDGKWALCMGDKTVIVLGDQQEEASDLLAVIRRQHFDLLCKVGKPEVGFTFLVRSH
jgi:hypothetical protein